MLRSAICLALCLAGSAQAALILNPGPNPAISQTVTVQPIVVADDDGSNRATYFGTAAQQAAIFALIDQIWAQAGIDVEWLAPNLWNNTSVNFGNPALSVRPGSDLNSMVTLGDAAGRGNSNPLVIDIYFVQRAAGFSALSLNSVAGLAFVGGNGISAYVGSNLLTFDAGREIIASVIAHEIGHNLGLPHIAEAFNLMLAGDEGLDDGQRLNALQITTALNSNLSVPTTIPEPSTYFLISGAFGLLLLRRRAA